MRAKRQFGLQGRAKERGFTLIELAIATVLLLVGVVAVMQLVPQAMTTNLRNRFDTTSAVVGQRFRDLMLRQAVNESFIVDTTGIFPCGPGGNCRFGDPLRNDQPVGAALRVTRDALTAQPADVLIDFTGAVELGYRLLYVDPNDPVRAGYEIRWTVVTSVRNVGTQPNLIVAKRVIIGVRRANDPSQAVFFQTLLVR